MSKERRRFGGPGKRLAIVGVGLMGGSLAAALREARFAESIVGVDADPGVLEEARSRGLIDRAQDLETAAREADIVVLATPLGTLPDLLARLSCGLPPQTIVTDMGSAKGSVAATGRDLNLARYVPGHPMAGSECSGPASARADLFAGRSVILTPSEITAPDAVGSVRAMWEAAGARVVLTDAATHDRLVAYTSHLPHLLAFTCAELLAGQEPAGTLAPFVGSGLKDFLRIAGSDPLMWRDVCAANAVFLGPALAAFAERLAALSEELARGDFEGLLEHFANARAFRAGLMKEVADGEH